VTEKEKTMLEDDPKQSEAFKRAVRELEAAGELSPEPEAEFVRAFQHIVPQSRRPLSKKR
jgi:hypothetical protein